MYDELKERCRACSQGCIYPSDCSYFDKPPLRCMRQLLSEAADAISELLSERDEVNADSWKTAFEVERDEHRWIPVTERLPEDIDEEVLVCTEDYGVSGLGFVTVATYGVSGWLECWERKTYLTAVTHWMPLPQPPEEE